MLPAEKNCPKAKASTKNLWGLSHCGGNVHPLITDLNTLVNTNDAARIAGVTASSIRSWKNRGHINPSGLDPQGRPLYRLADIIRAEHKTRQRNWQTA
jgi:hypothetical protein